MREEELLAAAKKEWGGTFHAYMKGFLISILLTSLSFTLVATKILPYLWTIVVICLFAATQAVTQLICFLHLRHEEAPYWKRHIFYLMCFFLSIVALGTLWIMYDLNVRTMDFLT